MITLAPRALDFLLVVFCILVGLRFFAPTTAPEMFDAFMGAVVVLMALILFTAVIL